MCWKINHRFGPVGPFSPQEIEKGLRSFLWNSLCEILLKHSSPAGTSDCWNLHPSIHFHPLSRRQQTQLADPDFPLTRDIFQLILGDPDAFTSQPGDVIPPACAGSSRGSPPRWTCLENLKREASESDARTTSAPQVYFPGLKWEHEICLLPV